MAAAEVLVRGCCSALNNTKHHLVSPWPPPLATSDDFKAEFLSPVQKNGQVTSRILFCNTKGCNHRGVPWSSLKDTTKEVLSHQNFKSNLHSSQGKESIIRNQDRLDSK